MKTVFSVYFTWLALLVPLKSEKSDGCVSTRVTPNCIYESYRYLNRYLDRYLNLTCSYDHQRNK